MLFLIGLLMMNLPSTQIRNTIFQTSPWFQVPKIATEPAPRIFINGIDSARGWEDCPWVNGSGTYDEPYIIHDLTINSGGGGSCIYITNTREYFRVENCTVTNAGTGSDDAGIRISNVTNGIIWNNTCYKDSSYGISLTSGSNNITLSGNNCTGNEEFGIYLDSVYNNSLSGNNCTNNFVSGIQLISAYNNSLSGNICSQNLHYGISLQLADYNTLNGNNCSGSVNYGIYLESSDYNQVFENTAKNNGFCPLMEVDSRRNDIHNNWFYLIPVASFSSDSPAWAETWVKFLDTTTSGDAPFAYQWDFGDDTANATDKNPTHYYTLPGTYTVILTVTDFDGDVSVYQKVIDVQKAIDVNQDWFWYVLGIIFACVVAGLAIVFWKWGPVLKKRRESRLNLVQQQNHVVHEQTLHQLQEDHRELMRKIQSADNHLGSGVDAEVTEREK